MNDSINSHRSHPDTGSRRTTIERVKLAQEAERWDDMATLIKPIIYQGRELSFDERNLFASAYKNVIGLKRLSWRILARIEQRPETSNRKRDLSKAYKRTIENEITDICTEVLQMIENYLITTIDIENKIFYLKMQGDYNRYLSEFMNGLSGDHAVESAKMAYCQAYDIARESLTPAHPLRLGLVLNYSVFNYDTLEKTDLACTLARQCLESGENDLRNQNEAAKDESVHILHQLKKNIQIWSKDSGEHNSNEEH